MFLFQLLKYFHGPYEVVGTFVLPSLFFAVLFFWPLLDRNPSHDPRKRPLAIGLVSVATLSLIGTTVWAIKSDTRMSNPVEALAPAAQPAAPLQRLDVVKLYTTHCLVCHGVDGTGNQLRPALPTIPNLTDAVWQQTQTDDQFRARIHDGKDPVMPAFKGKLNAQQIEVLAQYVRAFADKSAPAKSP
jgi:mono/diheme cytochrome c family protein